MLLASVALFGSCEDFLSKEDPNKIDAPSYFRNETDLQTYVNGFLQTMSPTAASVATGDARTDCLAWRGEYQFLTDNFDADDQSGWGTSDWEDLRNINYFLDNFRQAAVSETTLAHYEGVARFCVPISIGTRSRLSGQCPGTIRRSIPTTTRRFTSLATVANT